MYAPALKTLRALQLPFPYQFYIPSEHLHSVTSDEPKKTALEFSTQTTTRTRGHGRGGGSSRGSSATNARACRRGEYHVYHEVTKRQQAVGDVKSMLMGDCYCYYYCCSHAVNVTVPVLYPLNCHGTHGRIRVPH